MNNNIKLITAIDLLTNIRNVNDDTRKSIDVLLLAYMKSTQENKKLIDELSKIAKQSTEALSKER